MDELEKLVSAFKPHGIFDRQKKPQYDADLTNLDCQKVSCRSQRIYSGNEHFQPAIYGASSITSEIHSRAIECHHARN
jgi:hypothetical protein